MGVTSTVSRIPITVKVLPVPSNGDEGGGEQQPQQPPQQQGDAEEAESQQQQDSQTQGDEEAAHTGNAKPTRSCDEKRQSKKQKSTT